MNERQTLMVEVRTFLRAHDLKLESWSHAQIADMLSHPCSPLTTLPMLCPGRDHCIVTGCTMSDATTSIDRPCPLERSMALELFLGTVARSRIHRQDHRKIDVLWSLIRIVIQKRRLELRLLEEGVEQAAVEAIYQGKRRVTPEESTLPAFQGLRQVRQQELHLESVLRDLEKPRR